MADRKNFSRYNMRCGIVLRAQTGGMKLNGFDLPDLDSRFLLISSADIEGENSVEIFGTKMPILAMDTIDYPGQPLLVLFGPDYEGTQLEIEKIKVLATPLSSEEVKADDSQDTTIYYSWGLDEVAKVDEEKQKLKKTDTWLTVGHGVETRPIRFDMVAYTENSGSLHISGPMQWPQLVKDTIATVTGRLPGSITLHPAKYTSPYDEFLVEPAMLASYVAIAAIKSRIPCEIREDRSISRPGITYHLTTWTDAEDKPRHEEVDVAVDQGYASIAGDELKRQIMTGIIPKYDVVSFKGTVRSESTVSPLSVFCGSIGYTTASAARSLHMARIAARLGTNPLSFITGNTKAVTKFTDYAAHYDTRDMMAKAKTIGKDSDYLRKWTSSHLQRREFGLMGYRTGVGIATETGIAGFSNTFVKENEFKGVVSYNAKKHLAVSGAVPLSMTQDKGIRDTLASILSSMDCNDTLVFMEDNAETPDMGPNVLSSFQSLMLPRLMKSLSKIIPLTKVQDPPFSIVFSTQDTAIPCEFVHSGYGAAVCEVVLEKISLTPVVKHLWVNVSLDSFRTRNMAQNARRIVKESLAAIGAKVAPDFTLALDITEKTEDIKSFSSMESTIGSLVMGAYVSALWQAVGEKNSITIPASATQIERSLNGGNGEN